MKAPELTHFTLRRLRRHLAARRFAVPKLQRNFVWNAGHAAKLLDSIYKNMPIGSLFLWEMDRKSANLIRQSTEVLPSFNSMNKMVWFVIDGQQRLSVIYQAFEAQVRKNDAGRDIDFGRLCFAVDPDRDSANPARIVYRRPLDVQFVPIRDILAPDWKQRMPSHASKFLSKIDQCRYRILNYPVPIVTVRSATLEEIGEVFIRINSQGMRIRAADRAIALMGDLDVRAMAQELRQKIRDRAFALRDVDSILMGFNLISERLDPTGDPPKLEAMARRWSKRIEVDEDQREHFGKIWHKYQNAFSSAVDYLRDKFPVYDESYLPSANMLATLAVFFFHSTSQPDQRQRIEIRKWFWTTGVAQRYSGRGYHRNIVADAKFFSSLARGGRARFVFRDRLDPVQDIQNAEYTSRSTRTRTFFCLLALHKPEYLENGGPIPLRDRVISHANRKDRHHVFPQAQLRAHFSSRVYNSLCNICFLVSLDNQKIGMKLPARYLAASREAGPRQFRRFMKSHLIPVENDSGIWEKGIVRAFKEFRRRRLSMICTAFEKEAGIRLFRRN